MQLLFNTVFSCLHHSPFSKEKKKGKKKKLLETGEHIINEEIQ